MDLMPFKNLIRERSGLDFDNDRILTLENGIRSRMSEKGIASHNGYLDCLVNDQDEFSSFLNLLTINETFFFREPHHLNLLAEKLFHEMLTVRKDGARIKILSAGCSTGEEPYSLLISLMERYGPGIRNSVSVTGFDIDTNVIRKAREGIFTAYSFRNASGKFIEKYFEPAGINLFKIKDFVREGVDFCRLNLLDDYFPDELRGADVVFYRNVSIYFNPETQRSIFRKLSDVIKENGYLFVGTTETLSYNEDVLSLIEMDGVFLFRKMEGTIHDTNKMQDARHRMQPPPLSPSLLRGELRGGVVHPASGRSHSLIPPFTHSSKKTVNSVCATAGRQTDSPDVQSLFDKALSLAKTKKYEEAIKLIDALTEKNPAFVKAYMLKAGMLINRNQLEDAEETCLKGIEIDKWSLEGHLLLGLIAKIQDNQDTAFKRFKQAAYIQPSCWLAHYYLAEIYNSSGEPGSACREYEITVRQLANKRTGNHGLIFFSLAFSAEHIMHLCRKNISELKKALG